MSDNVDRAPIVPPDRAAELARFCPDLPTWPQRWCFDDADIDPGERIVEFLTPFLLHLLDQKLATKTLRNHRDNIWLLGGEAIRERYEDDEAKQLPIEKLVTSMVDEEGGPFVYPRITESEQESFDATCRKLHRFLNRPSPTSR